jgi:hypothetical protein
MKFYINDVHQIPIKECFLSLVVYTLFFHNGDGFKDFMRCNFI